MTQAIVPKELLTATAGGLSLLVVSGGADGQVLTQQADGTYAPEAVSAGIGGSVGSTDNRLVRSDGTGGSTVQSTGITVDDSNNVTGVVQITCTGAIRSAWQGNIAAPAVTFAENTTGVTASSGVQYFISQGVNNVRLFAGSGSYLEFVDNGIIKAFGSGGLKIGANGTIVFRNYALSADQAIACGDITASGLASIGVYTFATVPSASSNTGKFLRISDRSQKHAYSDGTNWRFFGDDAIIS